MKFTVVLVADAEEGGFNASVPALPGCRTFGETRKEAMDNAMEATRAYLGSLRKHGEPFPRE